ncbi:PREDICTED: uncharacterized protein K02A2.6-like, partial [Vollenhovia emeryi]|uniref:uncharacterized protein K02A2.6-like n=1 Tax=Vollenhovia emeryi TaxID=411798 RepID=UPI0005F54DA7
MTLEEIDLESGKDQVLGNVREAIKTGDWKKLEKSRFRIMRDELCCYNNIVLRGTRIVIPEALKRITLQIAHEGHPGIVAMKNRLRSKVWWDGIDRDAERTVKACKGCQLVQDTVSRPPVKRNELPTGPWESIALDLMGPMPTGENILVVTDYYSRYFEVQILKSTTTDKIIEVLFEIFARHGFPSTIVCDNGPQFANERFREWLSINGIRIAHTAPYWPQANGEVERQNRSLLKRLKIAHAEDKNWREEIQKFLLMYRSTPHSVTGG